jgi:hypothetical protein
MKIEELVILGLTGAAAYLYWKMRSQKTAVVTSSATYPMTYSPSSTAVVPVDSAPPSMPTMPMPSLPAPAPAPAPAPKPGVGRWLDQTTYRLEMPPTRDIMSPFLNNAPECGTPTNNAAYYGCAFPKEKENYDKCKAKGGYVVQSERELLGENYYGAKYSYCVDRDNPQGPTEVGRILNERCPQPICSTRMCPAMKPIKTTEEVFGKDLNYRYGKYRISKCVSAKGAS